MVTVKVPLVVIGDPVTVNSDGIVSATDVTVPVPTGKSAVTSALKVGVTAAPVVGPANIVLADWVAKLKAKVPEVVIGDPATVKIDGAVRATLVTAVWNVASSLRKCVVPAEAPGSGTSPDA